MANEITALKLFGTCQGEPTLNVFHYQIQGTGAPGVNFADSLITGFISVMGSSLQAALADNATFNRIEVICYAVPVIFGGQTIAWQGEEDSPEDDDSPSYLALSFRSNWNGPGSRRGYKRFGGVPLGHVQGNVITDAVYLGLLDDLAADMASDVVNSGNTFKPFVVQGPKVLGVNPTGYVITEWEFLKLTTQNTRKP